MSRAIDEKVVELRFDNKQFESGVKESLSTLDRLKTVLDKNISSKSLDNVTKAANSMDLSNITKNLESLSSRFSTLGIVGMTVIQNITEGLLGGLSKAVKTTTDSIVSGGIKRAMNIENAHFQLQGLIGDEEEVQAIMGDAMDSVDGTAYAYDEAAKAASMFAATGLRSGSEMQKTLKAIADVAATTNSEYSGISDIFTKIAGQGRMMGDDLNRLAVRGLNAASSLKDYMNGVNDGTIEASDSIKEYVKEITDGAAVTEADVRKMASQSKISFNLFSEAMSTVFNDHAKKANETFSGSMANIRAALARTGAMFVSPLVTQNGPFVQFFNAVRVKVNEFNKALGATNGIAEKFTAWVSSTIGKLTKLVEGFTVANMFVEKYSNGVEKAFETTHLKAQELSDGTVRVIVEDLYTPFGALRDLANSLVNILEGLLSVAKPIGRAFKDVFSFDVKNLYKAIEGFREFTEELVLSNKHSEQFQKLFTGIFKLIDSLRDLFVRTVSAIVKNVKPLSELSDNFFDLSEGIGGALSAIADFIKTSEGLNKIIEGIGAAIGTIINAMINAVDALSEAIKSIKAETTQKLLEGFEKVFEGLYEVAKALFGVLTELFSKIFDIEKPAGSMADGLLNGFGDLLLCIGKVLSGFADFINQSKLVQGAIDLIATAVKTLKDVIGKTFEFVIGLFKSFNISGALKTAENVLIGLKDVIFALLPDWVKEYLANIRDTIKEILDNIGVFDFSSINLSLDTFGEIFGNILGKAGGLDGIKNKFVNFFDFSTETSGINNFRKAGDNFVQWLQKNVLPAFENVNIPGLATTGGFIYIMIQVGKVLKALSDIMSSGGRTLIELPLVLKSLRKALDSYTSENTAKNMETAAKSILMVSGALALLSIIKPERLWPAIAAVAVIGTALTAISLAAKKAPQKFPTTIFDVLKTLSDGISKSLQDLAKAQVINAWGKAVRNIAIAVGLVVAEIAAMVILINKYPNDYKTSIAIIAAITTALVTIGVGLTAMATKLSDEMNAFNRFSGGVLKLSAAVLIAVVALKELMAVKLPSDYGTKLAILAGLFGAVVVLVLAVAAADRIGGKYTNIGIPIGSIAALIFASVLSLKMLFGIEIPDDWEFKLDLLKKIYMGVAALVLVVAVASRIGGDKSAKAFNSFIGISVLMISTVHTLDKLMKMEFSEDWALKLGVLGLIFAAVGAITLIIGKSNSKGGLKTFSSFLGIAVLLGEIVVALKVLEFFDTKKLYTNILALSAILFALSFTFNSVAKISGNGAGLAVLAMSLMVGTIVTSLMVLSIMSDKALFKGTLALCSILLVLAVTFAGVKEISNENTWKTILAMVGVLGGITAALLVLSVAKWSDILAGAVALSSVLYTLTKAFSAISESGTDPKDLLKNASIFLLLGLSLAEIAAALYAVSTQPWASILAAGASISSVLHFYTKTFESIGDVEVDSKQIAKFLFGCLSTIIIGAALWIAANRPWQGILAAGASISACLLAMGKAFEIMNSIEKISKESIAALLIGALGTIVIGAALWLAANQPWKQILAAGASISACLIAIGVAFGIINSTVNSANFLPAIAEFTACVVGILGVSEVIARLAKAADWKQLLASGVSISMVLLSMSVAMAVCSLAGSLAPAAIIGIALLDGFVADLALVLYALGKIPKEHQDILANGGEVLVNIGKAIGNFAGAIIEGIGHGIAKSLEEIGTSLSIFMENAQPFFEGLNNISTNTLANAQILAGVILAIASADLIAAISNFISIFSGKSGIETFAEDLSTLGKALTDFDNSTKSIKDPDHFRIVAEAAKHLVDLTKSLPNTGGLLGMILGNNDMDTWGTQLAILGSKIAEFAAKIRNIGDEDFARFKTFAKSVKPLVDMSLQLPMSGGLLGMILGNNDMGAWGKELSLMGGKVAEFAMSIRPISEEDFAKFSKYASSVVPLIDLSKSLPNSGGLIGLIMGKNDMNMWGSQLAVMGKYVAEFANHIRSITMEDFSKFVTFNSTTRNLVDLCAYIGASSGIKIKVEEAFTMCTSIKMIGEAVGKFSRDTADVDKSHISGMASVFRQLIDAVKSIGEFNGSKNVSEFSDALKKLATEGVKTFINEFTTQAPIAVKAINEFLQQSLKAVKKYDEEFEKAAIKNLESYNKGLENRITVTNIINSAKELVKLIKETIDNNSKNLEDSGKRCIKDFASGLKDSNSIREVENAVTDVLKKATEILKKDDNIFKETGKQNVKDYSSGLRDTWNLNEVYNAGVELADEVKRALKNNTNGFESIGEDCVKGFINGLEDSYMMSRVRRAARNMAEDAYESARRALDSHSPSRLFRKLGNYTGEGYKLGIEDTYNDISESAYDMAKSAKSGLDLAMSQITDQVDEIEDLYPVITPMVDLSNIISAASDISSMFNEALGSTIARTSIAGSYVRSGNVSNGVNEIQNGQGNQGNTYNFVQNNTSPKSLSQIELYRQSRNLFAQFREVVEGV